MVSELDDQSFESSPQVRAIDLPLHFSTSKHNDSVAFPASHCELDLECNSLSYELLRNCMYVRCNSYNKMERDLSPLS